LGRATKILEFGEINLILFEISSLRFQGKIMKANSSPLLSIKKSDSEIMGI
jgi:hypothetical protein